MMRGTNFSIMLLACFSLCLLHAGLMNTACAAQNNTKEFLQNDPHTIYGKVTDVITTADFTYTEVDTGKAKVWVAGPVDTSLKKGDMVAFSTKLPMRNFHSKSLGRDFSIIYFIKRYITDNDTSTPTANTPGEVEIGSYLRKATLNGLNGKDKTFSDFKGKPLIINIWASWCGPCRAEMGSLERLAHRYNGKEFNIIGVSTDDYRNKAVTFIKQTNISFENFLDNKLLLENMLGAKTIPLTILVNADGRVLAKVRGAREWDSPEIIDVIGQAFRIDLHLGSE